MIDFSHKSSFVHSATARSEPFRQSATRAEYRAASIHRASAGRGAAEGDYAAAANVLSHLYDELEAIGSGAFILWQALRRKAVAGG